jgi:hypothetical protein
MEEAREVGPEVDSEEEEMEEEGRVDVTTTMKKVIWPETTLAQGGHGALTTRKMGTQLKIAQK